MKKLIVAAVVAAAAAAGWAQVLVPGTGVANDNGYGPTRPVSVVYAPRTVETDYGYDDGMTVFGLTLLPFAFPNSSWDVTGVRFDLGWGYYRDTAALEAGLFCGSRNADGLFLTVFGNHSIGDCRGWQNGLVNVVNGRMSGLQVGLVNCAGSLSGVQIGLLNFARSQHFFPIVNIAW